MAVGVEVQEAHLVAQARRGDTCAFDALAERHRHGLYRVATRWVHDPGTAPDCVQETLARAYDSLSRFRDADASYQWLAGRLLRGAGRSTRSSQRAGLSWKCR